ncbi:MAG TPA: subclass B3 metallo-beta-lactamase [Bryobacteraceae bacterium]|nr:subclass B3 metallo-beta-lactamase [Bryobacteraceae bacterium]
MRRPLPFLPALLYSLLLTPVISAQVVPKWNKPTPPFRIAGNIYYVGTNYLASYLITTPAGDILINPDYTESVPLIEKSVAQLGHKFSDIKIILISHAHDDHAAGCAVAKKLSGARLMVMEQDVPLIETGGAGDFAYHARWAPAKVDRVLHDGDKVTLSGTTLVAHLTPGHTKGCTTWTTDVVDNGQIHHAVIIGSTTIGPNYRLVANPQYPAIAKDYEQTFRVLHSLPCDLFLGAHGVYFNLDEKRKRMNDGGPNPFIDPAGYQAFVNETEQNFKNQLAKQQAAKPLKGTT